MISEYGVGLSAVYKSEFISFRLFQKKLKKVLENLL